MDPGSLVIVVQPTDPVVLLNRRLVWPSTGRLVMGTQTGIHPHTGEFGKDEPLGMPLRSIEKPRHQNGRMQRKVSLPCGQGCDLEDPTPVVDQVYFGLHPNSRDH